jgi:glutathione S-transferase
MHLERRFPEPPLLPADPALRERALALAARFDDEVGPAVRLATFFELMSADYASRTFCAGKPPLARAAYRAAFPLISRVMKRSMHIDAANAAVARERTREALDFVAKEGAATGHLVGDAFTIADLTAAALLMPTLDVGEQPPPESAAERAWLARWSDHPGVAWVREIYRRHRGAA